MVSIPPYTHAHTHAHKLLSELDVDTFKLYKGFYIFLAIHLASTVMGASSSLKLLLILMILSPCIFHGEERERERAESRERESREII